MSPSTLRRWTLLVVLASALAVCGVPSASADAVDDLIPAITFAVVPADVVPAPENGSLSCSLSAVAPDEYPASAQPFTEHMRGEVHSQCNAATIHQGIRASLQYQSTHDVMCSHDGSYANVTPNVTTVDCDSTYWRRGVYVTGGFGAFTFPFRLDRSVPAPKGCHYMSDYAVGCSVFSDGYYADLASV